MQAPPPFPPPTHALPPVLQQLQGVLSNSNQNGAFLPNNNTMVSSTVASSFLQSGGQQGGGSNDGSGGMNGGPAPRDPRVDPRVDPRLDPRLVNRDVAQHGQQGHQGQQAPPLAPPHGQAPMFGAPASIHPSMLPPGAALAGSNAPGLLGPGFDGETMARLASLLNHSNDPSKASHLPVGPGSFATGPVSLPVHLPGRAPQDAGRPEPTEDSPLRGHPSLPSRPRMAPDPFQQRPNEVNGNFPSPMDESPSNKREFPVVTEDPTAGPDQIRVISRTLWVGGGFVPTIPEPELEEIFAVKGKISTIMINPSKFNAFIKMVDRPQAERCKAELDRTTVHGEVMKVGWGCGFGPRDCFDYTAGTSLIPIDRLTDTDRRWLSNSVVGGFGPRERIRGGVVILEPNIEPVAPDGREALPRKSRNPGSIGGTPAAGGRGGRGSGASGGGSGGGGVSGGSGSGSGSGPGRGRGRGGPMSTDQQDTAGGPRGRGMGTGRGRGLEEPDQQQWSHPLPHRPQTTQVGFQGQQGQGPTWGGKRDSGQNHIQDQDAGPFQQQQDEETRRSKKSRWE
ncbi:MAG: hypothetical protein J3Q66DRAFT_351581 [Benniella sp.]|nr:MAG: hypothetical protein J3Q66DRAFT_351581 [Benniella sp.]